MLCFREFPAGSLHIQTLKPVANNVLIIEAELINVALKI